jgi:hypothetical protein
VSTFGTLVLLLVSEGSLFFLIPISAGCAQVHLYLTWFPIFTLLWIVLPSPFSCPPFSSGCVGAPVFSIIEGCSAKRIWFHFNNLLKNKVCVKSHLEPRYRVFTVMVRVITWATLFFHQYSGQLCVHACVCAWKRAM